MRHWSHLCCILPVRHSYIHQYSINQHDAGGQWPLLLHFLTTLHVSGASCTHHQEYNCICSLWHKYTSDDRLPTWQSLNSATQEGGHPRCNLCQRLHIQLLFSWWWVQEAPETCRVVKKCSNKGHCPAASCWFIEYWYVMHGTMNLKLHSSVQWNVMHAGKGILCVSSSWNALCCYSTATVSKKIKTITQRKQSIHASYKHLTNPSCGHKGKSTRSSVNAEHDDTI